MNTAPNKPAIVPANVSADWANRTYGEAYGVDWQYAMPEDTTRAHVSPPQWVPFTTDITQYAMGGEQLRHFRVAIPGRSDYEAWARKDKPLSEFIDRFNAVAKAECWGVYTSAQEPRPTLSEYIHPAHCEPDDEEPPSEWREVALYLAMAAVALIAVVLLYAGTARASSLGPEIVVDGSFDDGSAWAPGYSWQILPAPGGLAFHNEGYSWPIQQITASLIPGTTYRVSYVISGSYTSSDARHRFRIRGTTTSATCPLATGDGVHVCYIVAPPGAYSLQVLPAYGFAGILDDVSVREVML